MAWRIVTMLLKDHVINQIKVESLVE